MPTKRLPPELVRKLRNLFTELSKQNPQTAYKLLGGMKNIDHRRQSIELPDTNTEMYGRRIREMNVSRNFPGVKLVIKRAHNKSAQKTIDDIMKKVREHKIMNRGKEIPYEFVAPHAYAIGAQLIAMHKVDIPSVYEIRGEQPTERGREYFKKLKRKYGVTDEELELAKKHLVGQIGISSANILLIGVRNGKFVFMPLLDYF